jgi:hypothetical protein
MNVDPNDPEGRENEGEMAGWDKTAEDLEARPLTKGEKAHARRMAADPDMQPELKTYPLVLGKNAKTANEEPVEHSNPVVEEVEKVKKNGGNTSTKGGEPAQPLAESSAVEDADDEASTAEAPADIEDVNEADE